MELEKRDFPMEKGKANLPNFHETESRGDYFSWGKGKSFEENVHNFWVPAAFSNLNLTRRDGQELVKSVLKERKRTSI